MKVKKRIDGTSLSERALIRELERLKARQVSADSELIIDLRGTWANKKSRVRKDGLVRSYFKKHPMLKIKTSILLTNNPFAYSKVNPNNDPEKQDNDFVSSLYVI